MGRITDLVDAHRPRKGPTCTVGLAIATYPKPEQTEWLEVLAATVPHTVIAEAFKADNHPEVKPSAISRHRTGKCMCGPNS